MRPVNKGESPYQFIKDYKDAQSFLENRIGIYCSYCEMPIINAPEVEHIVSKTNGGDKTKWENLLLGCKYCNSRKLSITTPINAGEYLWPDSYNSAIAYTYDGAVPKVAKERLLRIEPEGEIYKKAQKLFDLVKLDNMPTPKQKDRRFKQRYQVYQYAREWLTDWNKIKTAQYENKEIAKRQIINMALVSGFFSVWMNVFGEEPEIRLKLIESFPGTQTQYYDEDGQEKEILIVEDT